MSDLMPQQNNKTLNLCNLQLLTLFRLIHSRSSFMQRRVTQMHTAPECRSVINYVLISLITIQWRQVLLGSGCLLMHQKMAWIGPALQQSRLLKNLERRSTRSSGEFCSRKLILFTDQPEARLILGSLNRCYIGLPLQYMLDFDCDFEPTVRLYCRFDNLSMNLR